MRCHKFIRMNRYYTLGDEVVAVATMKKDPIVRSTHRPDILLLDVSLPEVNGFAVTKKVQQDTPEVRIVFVTAYCDRNYVERAFEIGATGYVLKGSVRTDLLSAIRHVMEGQPYRSPSLA
jgi:DNA-binding NarL/FixJ family response regulator